MAFKGSVIFNIDKKKQCYHQPSELFNHLSQFTTDKYIDFEGFKLHITNDGRSEKNDKPPIRIKSDVLLSDGTLLGDFEFHNSAQYDGLCFFNFTNASLYDLTSYMYGEKFNHQSDIEYISDVLGLGLNNYTEIEVAADVNVNIIAKIEKLIKDYQNFDMIVNGKRVEDENRRLEGFGEYYGRTRVKRDKYPTLYFSQSKSDGLALKIYDKTREVIEENPHKKYILDWDNFGKRKVYRLELTIRNEQFKKWLEYVRTGDAGVMREWGDFGRSEGLLMLQAYKLPTLGFWSRQARLLAF